MESRRKKAGAGGIGGKAVIPLGRKRFPVKAAVLLLVMAALFSAGISVYGKEKEGGTSDGNLVLETVVSGQSKRVEEGKAELILPDGTLVRAEGTKLPDGLLLVLEEITESNRDLYGWAEKALEGKGTKLRVYDIYFVDSGGGKYEPEAPFTVTISLEGAYTSPVVYSISKDGGRTLLESRVKGDKISFVPVYGSYAVLVETAEEPSPGPGEPVTETPTEAETPTENEAPTTAASGKAAHTGDETQAGLWLVLALVSGAIAAAMGRRWTAGK